MTGLISCRIPEILTLFGGPPGTFSAVTKYFTEQMICWDAKHPKTNGAA
jgi:hypothetical protein